MNKYNIDFFYMYLLTEVLWQNSSDFYVHLRVEVGKHPQVILAMYFYLEQE
jgi:hypothetical protein